MIYRQIHPVHLLEVLVLSSLLWVTDLHAEDSSGVHRDAWYLGQDGQNATIQLSGHKSEADAMAYIRAQKLVGDVGYFSTRYKDMPWFAVTYGIYESLDAARTGLKLLPESLRRHSPWPRTFSTIKSIINTPVAATEASVAATDIAESKKPEEPEVVVAATAAANEPEKPESVSWADGQAAYEKEDFGRAFTIWKTLGEQGEAVSQFNLGVMYSRGEGVKQNGNQAIEWYTRSAEQGYAPAQFNLGAIYLDGKFVTPDERKTAAWWQLAAEQDFVQAQYNIGSLYCRGIGVFRDLEQCKYWYGRAAKNGDEHASKMLAQITASEAQQQEKLAADAAELEDNAKEASPDSDKTAAVEMTAEPEKSTDSTLPVASSTVPEKTKTTLSSADRKGLRKAQSLFIRGDYAGSHALWLPLAMKGIAEAQYSLGFLYQSGWEVERSPQQAVDWYTRAAEQEESRAQFNLGVLLLSGGEGVAQDTDAGTEWVTRSATNNNERAKQFLAEAYSKGLYGLEKSEEKAQYWRSK